MNNSEVKKYQKFVRQLSSRRGGVNNIVLGEDLEQELWLKLFRNWNKKHKVSGRSLADMSETEVKRMITTMFKNLTKDVVRKYLTRYDTYQCAKFSFYDQDRQNTEEVNIELHVAKRSYSTEEQQEMYQNTKRSPKTSVESFSHCPENPIESIERNAVVSDILDWTEDLPPEEKFLVECSMLMPKEVEDKCEKIYGKSKRQRYPNYVVSEAVGVSPARGSAVMKELKQFLEFRSRKIG